MSVRPEGSLSIGDARIGPSAYLRFEVPKTLLLRSLRISDCCMRLSGLVASRVLPALLETMLLIPGLVMLWDTTGGWQRSHRVFTCARNYFSKALTLTVDFADDSALAMRRFSLSIVYILVRLLTSCAAKRLWTEPGTTGRGHAYKYGSLLSFRSSSASYIVLELLILASFICNRLLELAFIVVCGSALVGCSAGSFNADSSLSRIREALLCICKDVCIGLARRFFEARNELGE